MDRSGQRTARALVERGYGSGLADSAILDAQNRRSDAGNQFLAQLLDPSNQAARLSAASSLYGGDVSQLLALMQGSAAQRSADAQYRASRPPSLLESLLGIGGQVLPYVIGNQSGRQYSGYDPMGNRPGVF